MKFWMKILVAFCVVLVVAFTVWAFFFREKDEVVAYNEISELLEYKESTGFRVKLDKIGKMNYLNNDSSIIISGESETISEIIKLRNKNLSKQHISVFDVDDTLLFEYNSYYMVDEYCDEFVEYMLPNLNNIEGSSSTLKKLKKAKKEYVSALQETMEALDLVLECQTSITGTSIEYDVLLGKYNSFSFEFRNLLNKYSDVMSYILSYYKSAKGGEILTNSYVSLNDAFARTLDTMTSVELISELDYANDLYYVSTKIDKVNNDESIFSGEFTELNYLNAYNDLFNEHSDVLDKVFAKKYIEKKQMADNQNLSEIPENLHHNVMIILNILGY